MLTMPPANSTRRAHGGPQRDSAPSKRRRLPAQEPFRLELPVPTERCPGPLTSRSAVQRARQTGKPPGDCADQSRRRPRPSTDCDPHASRRSTSRQRPSKGLPHAPLLSRWLMADRSLPHAGWLIRPPENDYSGYNIAIHGIRPDDTRQSPEFLEVWREVLEVIGDRPLVAHNASFDLSVLRQSLDQAGAEWPTLKRFLHPCCLAGGFGRVSPPTACLPCPGSSASRSCGTTIPLRTRLRAPRSRVACARLWRSTTFWR